MNKPTKILQPPELERYDLLKKVCDEGRQVFFLTGMALGEIKEREFYKADGFATFEDFAEAKGYSRRHCNQLILDAAAIKTLPPALRQLVTTERAARELAKIPEALREAVVEVASSGGSKPATKATIKKASPKPPPRKVEAKRSAPPRKPSNVARKPAVELPRDATGLEIPVEVLGLWNRSSEVQELLTFISSVRGKLKRAQEMKDGLFAALNFTSVLANLDQAFAEVKASKPYAVCATCQGKLSKGCRPCHETGIVGQHFWDTCVPEEAKAIRKG